MFDESKDSAPGNLTVLYQSLSDALDGALARVFVRAFPNVFPGDRVHAAEAIPRLLAAMNVLCLSGDQAVCALDRDWRWTAAEQVLDAFADEHDLHVWGGGPDAGKARGQYVSKGRL
jgi:hypothetical protein